MASPMSSVWVVDTSSLLSIKHYLKHESHQKYLGYLTEQSECLYCPPQVIKELLRGKDEDVFAQWAKKKRDCYLNIDNREYRLLLLTTLLSYVLP